MSSGPTAFPLFIFFILSLILLPLPGSLTVFHHSYSCSHFLHSAAWKILFSPPQHSFVHFHLRPFSTPAVCLANQYKSFVLPQGRASQTNDYKPLPLLSTPLCWTQTPRTPINFLPLPWYATCSLPLPLNIFQLYFTLKSTCLLTSVQWKHPVSHSTSAGLSQ